MKNEAILLAVMSKPQSYEEREIKVSSSVEKKQTRREFATYDQGSSQKFGPDVSSTESDQSLHGPVVLRDCLPYHSRIRGRSRLDAKKSLELNSTAGVGILRKNDALKLAREFGETGKECSLVSAHYAHTARRKEKNNGREEGRQLQKDSSSHRKVCLLAFFDVLTIRPLPHISLPL